MSRVAAAGRGLRRADNGSAAVAALGILFACVLVGTTLAGLGSVHVAAARAQGIADAAALAAAYVARDARALGSDGERACAVAREVAMRSHATLASCVVHTGGSVSVVAEVATAFGAVRRGARAGTA